MSVDWNYARQAGAQTTRNLNKAPFVFDPAQLTGDAAANIALLYPKMGATGDAQPNTPSAAGAGGPPKGILDMLMHARGGAWANALQQGGTAQLPLEMLEGSVNQIVDQVRQAGLLGAYGLPADYTYKRGAA